jgi:curved DNA-binding protein CbpA
VNTAEIAQVCNMLDELDYFQVLKVERTAGMVEIKKAFYRESRAYHPDRFFHLSDETLKDRVNSIYKRVTEAYYVLRDDPKKKKYLADISGPERKTKLRFTDASEAESKAATKKEQEEQIGTHPKGRQFYLTGVQDAEGQRWAAAERNIRMALMFEKDNVRYKEKLAEVLKQMKAK